MRKTISALLVVGFLVGSAGILKAASTSFTASATVPAATNVQISAFKTTTGASPVTTAVSGTALSFDPLSFDSTNQIWVPGHFFYITATPIGGSGSTNTSVKYTEGANPNGSSTTVHGLGYKTVATYVRVNGTTETQIAKEALKDTVAGSGRTISSAQLSGGFFKVYLGIITDPTGISGGEVFSAADAQGTYSGTVLVTSTLA